MKTPLVARPFVFFRERLIRPLLDLLKQGVTPDKLALAVALGLVLGIFPVIGATTLLCFVFGLLLRLNMVAIQLVNYFSYPLQLTFYIPFFSAGAWLFGAEMIPFSLDEIFLRLAEQPWETIASLWTANLRGIVVWLITAPPLGLVLFLILRSVFTRVVSSGIFAGR